jgi:hypothetical protein
MNIQTKTKRKTIAVLLGMSVLTSSSDVKAAEPVRRDLAAIKEQQTSATPAQVLHWLKDGNERFASGKQKNRDMLHDQPIINVTSS